MRHETLPDRPIAPDAAIAHAVELILGTLMDLKRLIWPENGTLKIRGTIGASLRAAIVKYKTAIIQRLTVTSEQLPLITSEALLYHLMGRRWMQMQEMETGAYVRTSDYERILYWFCRMDIIYRRLVNERIAREQLQEVAA